MPVPLILKCAKCGAVLAVASEYVDSTRNDNATELKIVPCPACIENRYKDGFDEGLVDGRVAGYKDGIRKGD